MDVPRCDSLYAPLESSVRGKLRGGGFTLYGLLEDCPEVAEKRGRWRDDLPKYDLIVIGNIWRQPHLYQAAARIVAAEKIAVLDGEDSSRLFPMARRSRRHFLPALKLLKRSRYFKRELGNAADSCGLQALVPEAIASRIPLPVRIFEIGFSIPAEKIHRVAAGSKRKDFARHVVDEEVAAVLAQAFYSGVGSDRHLFQSETEYYADLQSSRFGITTKRAGWDCLRHYELAANGCVLCFRDLSKKPPRTAPHQLTSLNCIGYQSARDLLDRVSAITPDEYASLLQSSYDWISQNTTQARARQFLDCCELIMPTSGPLN